MQFQPFCICAQNRKQYYLWILIFSSNHLCASACTMANRLWLAFIIGMHLIEACVPPVLREHFLICIRTLVAASVSHLHLCAICDQFLDVLIKTLSWQVESLWFSSHKNQVRYLGYWGWHHNMVGLLMLHLHQSRYIWKHPFLYVMAFHP